MIIKGVGILTQPLFISNNMAKNCLNKLTSNITVGCTIAPVGVMDIYLMHAEDVTFTIDPITGRISAATFASGTRSYRVEGYKQNIQVNGSLKSLDASATMDASVTFKVQCDPDMADFVNTMTKGKFYVLVSYNCDFSAILGATVPLECSAADFDSNANAGMITITLATPEGAAGCPMIVPYNAARDTIISKSV